VRLDESHGGCDPAQELGIRFLDRPLRENLRGRLRWRGDRSLGAVPTRRELERAPDDRVLRDEAVAPLLEQPPPLGIDGLGGLEILVEEVSNVAEIHSVDVFRWHRPSLLVHLSEIGSPH
jgi:hypothetical protein